MYSSGCAIKAYQKAGFSIVGKTDEETTLKQFLKEEYFSLYAEGNYGRDGTRTLVKTV